MEFGHIVLSWQEMAPLKHRRLDANDAKDNKRKLSEAWLPDDIQKDHREMAFVVVKSSLMKTQTG